MSLRFFLPPARRFSVAGMAAALLLTSLAPVRADIQQARQRRLPANRSLRDLPPNGVEQTVQVNLGGRVDITLEAHGQTGKTIEFILRDLPLHGTLTDLRPLTRNSAAVTYVQDPGDPAENDQFTYAVQARGSVVSAATAVPIQIIPLPPRLIATPAALDFGVVDVGGTSRAQVTIENQGGSVAAGRLLPPSPWVIEGSPDYRIAPGEKRTFQLVFTPGFGKVFEDEVVLGNLASQRVRLVGTGIGREAPLKLAAADAGGNPVEARGAGSTGRVALGDLGSASAARSVASGGRAGAPGGAAAAGSPGNPAGPAPTPFAASPTVLPGAPNPAGRDPAILNDAGVEKLEVRWSDAHGMKIAWKTPSPPPKGYRVELRYLSLDPDHNLVVDWRSYARVEFTTAAGETAAVLCGLPSGTRQTVRVVAVDGQGRAAAPSSFVQADLAPGANWLRITPLRLMLMALAVCLALIWRRKRETRLILQSISDARTPAQSYG